MNIFDYLAIAAKLVAPIFLFAGMYQMVMATTQHRSQKRSWIIVSGFFYWLSVSWFFSIVARTIRSDVPPSTIDWVFIGIVVAVTSVLALYALAELFSMIIALFARSI